MLCWWYWADLGPQRERPTSKRRRAPASFQQPMILGTGSLPHVPQLRPQNINAALGGVVALHQTHSSSFSIGYQSAGDEPRVWLSALHLRFRSGGGPFAAGGGL